MTSVTSSLDDQLDWELLRLVDESAFTSLFTRHNRRVYNHCFRRLGSWSQAEDATQATFLTLWRRAREGTIDELRGTTAVPILLGMASQECLTQARSHSRRTGLMGRLRLVRETTSDEPDEWLEAEVTMRAINDSLALLDEGQRQVVELVCWNELSVAEVAEALGIAPGTVKSRLHRARAALADSPAARLLDGEDE